MDTQAEQKAQGDAAGLEGLWKTGSTPQGARTKVEQEGRRSTVELKGLEG